MTNNQINSTKSASKILVLYCIFSGLSASINLACQIISIAIYKGDFYVELSILVGTIAGMPIRYILEKHHIFSYQSKNIVHDSQLFLVYTAFSIVTTGIFWSTEYIFHLIFSNDTMRYIGGAIGLSLGYYIKYQLDKKYVFVISH